MLGVGIACGTFWLITHFCGNDAWPTAIYITLLALYTCYVTLHYLMQGEEMPRHCDCDACLQDEEEERARQRAELKVIITVRR